jgi:hypothetical protein
MRALFSSWCGQNATLDRTLEYQHFSCELLPYELPLIDFDSSIAAVAGSRMRNVT